MERNHKPIDWSNCPPIEECTSFGDTNGNHADIAMSNIDERVITLDTSKLVMPTSEEIQELQKYGKANWEDYPPNLTPMDGTDYPNRAFIDVDNEKAITLNATQGNTVSLENKHFD